MGQRRSVRALRIFSAVVAVCLLCAPSVSASRVEDRQQGARVVVLPPGTVVNGNYFAAGETVRVSGTVNGDVYAAAGEVIVDGTVNGDLLAMGGTVTVSGRVAQDLRSAGGRIILEGPVGKDATVAGGDISLSRGATVAKSFAAAGGSVALEGRVAGEARVVSGKLSVGDRIGGDLIATAGRIVLAPGATIAGDFSYRSRQPAVIDKEAAVGGSVTYHPMERLVPSWREVAHFMTGLFVFLKIVSYLSTLLIGLALLALFPGFTRDTVTVLKTAPWGSLGVGFALFVLNPLLILLLLLTVVGIPFALILLALYLASLYIARLFVIFWAGQALLKRMGKEARPGGTLALGMAVYILLSIIPVFGSLVSLFVLLFGLGAMGMAVRNAYLKAP